ncbi:MAG: LEA type 2 family protein [Spirochaetota bacterium]|nr:LEA type 2 family protein [Spirochaetota bacterium]
MKTVRTYLPALMVLAAAMMMAACAATEDAPSLLPEPEAEIRSIELTGLSFDRIDLEAAVAVRNPLPTGLKIEGYAYSLEASGRTLLSGRTEEPLQLDARSETVLTVSLSVPVEELAGLIREDAGRNILPYTLSLEVGISSPVASRPLNVNLSRSGELPVPRRPDIAIQELVITEFGNLDIAFDIVLRVANPNVFDISLENLGYRVVVDEIPWTEGSLQRTYIIPSEGEQTLRIPLEFNYLKVGRATVNLLVADKTLDYDLDGELQIGIQWKGRSLGSFGFGYSRSGAATIIRPDRFGL